MEIKLYKTNSNSNVINKVLTDVVSVNIVLLKGIDIIYPEFVLDSSDINKFEELNYIDIPELNRTYFIDSKQLKYKNIWVLRCSCDLLETYKADVLGSTARFNRNIKIGDYSDVGINYSVNKNVELFFSDKELTGEPTMILSVLGSA